MNKKSDTCAKIMNGYIARFAAHIAPTVRRMFHDGRADSSRWSGGVTDGATVVTIDIVIRATPEAS